MLCLLHKTYNTFCQLSGKANDIHWKDKPLKRYKPQERFAKTAEKRISNTGLADIARHDVLNKNDRNLHTEIEEVTEQSFQQTILSCDKQN